MIFLMEEIKTVHGHGEVLIGFMKDAVHLMAG